MKKIKISFAEDVEPDFVCKLEIWFSGFRLISLVMSCISKIFQQYTLVIVVRSVVKGGPKLGSFLELLRVS